MTRNVTTGDAPAGEVARGGAPTGGAPVRIVVATGNAHKLDEIRAILTEVAPTEEGATGHSPPARDALDPAATELVPMTDLGVPSPVEDGDTFEANALLKARACAAATGHLALADDSGIEVDALDGAPGVHSARYAGPDADDAANNAKLLAALDGVPSDARTARFVCAAAAVHPDGREVVVRGTMEGRVLDAPRGEAGFGYDPLFVAGATTDGRTNAELAAHEKDRISHRGAAFRTLRAELLELLTDR